MAMTIVKGRTIVVVLVICGLLPASSLAAPTVKLDMGFTPYRLGAATTISFGFDVESTPDTPVSPIAKVDFNLPSTVAYDTSTLGLTSCSPRRLSERGLAGCSPNARIGLGKALVAVPFGLGTLTETANITTFVGNSENGHIEILYYAIGTTPVISQFTLLGEMLSNASGEHITTTIPEIPTLPGAPSAAVIELKSTIGPRNLYYYASIHGRRVRFRPRGIALPSACPRGGFLFSARFSFQDGDEATTKDTVQCPSRHHRQTITQSK
jgi:hypothetical protein